MNITNPLSQSDYQQVNVISNPSTDSLQIQGYTGSPVIKLLNTSPSGQASNFIVSPYNSKEQLEYNSSGFTRSGMSNRFGSTGKPWCEIYMRERGTLSQNTDAQMKISYKSDTNAIEFLAL